MSLGNRLKYYIENYYISLDQFSKDFEIDRTTLSRYFNDKSRPSFEKFEIFYNIGISIDWLLSGKGDPFNDDIIDILKKNKHLKLDMPPNEKNMRQLKKWIIANYGSLISLCDEFGYDYKKMFKIIENKHIPDSKFIRNIERAGCNVVWFYTGKGSSYANNPMGFILQNKMKAEGNIKVNQELANEASENIHKLIDVAIRNDIGIYIKDK